MFDNNDNFGIDSFRDDFKYICSMNLIQVKRTQKNKQDIEKLTGDFFGSFASELKDEGDLILINLMSTMPDKTTLELEGYGKRGNVEYAGCCEYNIIIQHLDTIEFIQDNEFGIKKGEKYKVLIEDEGLYQGQYCFKFFKLVRI